LGQAARLCPRLPQDMACQVEEVLRLSTGAAEGLLTAIDRLVDGLQEIIVDK
jgi:hypothetical protein